MSLSRHIPFRMCIGCGSRRKKDEMIRFVQDASGSIVTGPGNLRGRGFYLCPDLVCLDTARKKMRRVRSLKSVDFEELRYRISREKGKQEEEE